VVSRATIIQLITEWYDEVTIFTAKHLLHKKLNTEGRELKKYVGSKKAQDNLQDM